MSINYIKTLINNSDGQHPLKKSLDLGTRYYKNFEEIIDDMLKFTKIFSQKDMDNLLREKLQLGKKEFNLEAYYQGATELSIVYKIFEISKEQKASFEYEKCINGTEKKIECFLQSDSYKVNIEAKCPDLTCPESNSQKKTMKYMVAGRIPDHEEMFTKVKSIEKSNNEVEVKEIKNKDNTLKDFLQSAHDKFPDFRDEYELNVLFVSLDDKSNIMQWWNYLYENQGLLTVNPFAEHQTFSRVDVIIYTNLLYRHKNNEDINGNAWDLDNSFNLFIRNQFRQVCNKNHLDCKKEVCNFFGQHIKNFTAELCDFAKSKDGKTISAIPGKGNMDLTSMLIIPRFISKLEENGKFYFDKSNK